MSITTKFAHRQFQIDFLFAWQNIHLFLIMSIFITSDDLSTKVDASLSRLPKGFWNWTNNLLIRLDLFKCALCINL